ncbi:hypothetical protein DEU56DRAFT_200304 [Suillus clintonianus]|uniref:uncharacterized protein n=1 Tax=Suillus clintonianus TaxID=1904413 RepID=UPI001B865BA5|nr:uncharacterized protein DEU56DRAFT_200304 [Suillus clintonianus]KAG2112859.1 hypothetical protein DEU56DRAFT_200304 [Suillus clintonianus]
MILVDMLAFSNDHPSPATIILIAGDRDYAYAVSILRLRQYNVVLIVPPTPNIPQSLESQASVVVDWNFAVLGKRTESDAPPVRQPYRNFDQDVMERLSRVVYDSNEDPVGTPVSSNLPEKPAHTRRDSAAGPLQPSAFDRNTGAGGTAQPVSSCTEKAASTIPATPVLPRTGSVPSRARFATQSTQTVPDIDRDLGNPLKANNPLSNESLTDDFVSTTNEIQDASRGPFATAPSSSSGLECNQNIAEPGLTPTMGLRNVPLSPLTAVPHNSDLQIAPLGSPLQTRIISGCTPVSFGNNPHRTVPAAAVSLSPVLTCGEGDIITVPKSTNPSSVSAYMDDCVIPSDNASVVDALGLDIAEDRNHNKIDEVANVSVTSPLLPEVDDPSFVQVANSAESYHTTGDAYIATSLPAKNSPPTPEPSVTPVSQMSSSTLSTPSSSASSTSIASDSNVTMPNVEIGSQQATFVISNNKDKSSVCQAPPVDSESIEDKIRRLTPPEFLPLIKQLLLARSKNIMKPSRSDIANDMVRSDKDVYKRAGATKFADYALLAKEASVIVFGGGTTRSNSWIALHPNWFRQEIGAPKPSTPSPDPSNKPPTPQDNISDVKILSMAPTPPSSTALQETTRLTTLNPDAPPSVPIPPYFQPLITCLSKVHRRGLVRPFLSTVGLEVGPEIYLQAGVSSLAEYISRAADAGVVHCGANSGHAWVSLHPDVLRGKRPC